jgi:hypothetical protein
VDWIRRASTAEIGDIARITVPMRTDPQDVLEPVRAEEFDIVEGVVVEAALDRYAPDVLRGVRGVIDDNFQAMPTLLVGIDHDTKRLTEAAELFDATIAVAPHKKRRIHRLEPHYPGLLRQVDRFGDLGSVRTFDVAVTDHWTTVEALRNKRGDPLHPFAETNHTPFYAYRAPDQFADVVNRVLGERGQVIDAQRIRRETLSVTGFTFGVDAPEGDGDASVPVSG